MKARISFVLAGGIARLTGRSRLTEAGKVMDSWVGGVTSPARGVWMGMGVVGRG